MFLRLLFIGLPTRGSPHLARTPNAIQLLSLLVHHRKLEERRICILHTNMQHWVAGLTRTRSKALAQWCIWWQL